ncbi:transcriptional regulator GcvA [Cocleimonas flava]|uniref:LysR family transcriptional regulator n=1 Tax=Cocleimonas flava TaxID=634765 RepID=A0A4R1ERX6_9GAMM|nr:MULTISPECIES: transcriptional regulator GcvA [Cocleimonas]MEB8432825.1 transcriptional regulator GcvA [Cocleimonas sp. KMM 6892]MEC4715684.1 transcriptional regulator GcvA [Cocleimonas sp. KMM 6895]MEC4744698.1 transcriptional regulator GcvA [Cocleimonas sp. KMM 6896]TCJ83250.1 LysR family transcriptional regulator [Cocleimonas flava]
MPTSHLPPLTALRTFEAVARLKSFTKAANELYVTRAAVSHQIKNLEDYLGFQLIHRQTRSIALTPAAEAALPKLREGFNNLSDAVHLMSSHQTNENLTVWMAPSFASKWLVPRLHSFSLKYPEIDMQISGTTGLVDAEDGNVSMEEIFRANNVDVAIRFGSGNYPGCAVDKLFSVKAIPMCSPDLLNNPDKPLKTPEDLKFHTLLHDNTDYKGRPEWKPWLKHAGVTGVKVDRGLRFNHVSLAMDAAIDGQGVLMGIEMLARSDIEAGRLCQPFDLSLPLERSYYVIRPESMDSNRHAVDAFIEWILEEAKLDQDN